MTLKVLTVLIVTPLVCANIQVSVVVSDKESEGLVKLAGINKDIIGDHDIMDFKLNDFNVKNGVEKSMGKRPTDVFLKSPTPWGDLYSRYNWEQVSRILTPTKGTLLGIQSQPTIVAKKYLTNNNSEVDTFHASITEEVATTFSNTWDRGGEVSVGQEITYGFDIKLISVAGKTSFSYTSKWGTSTSKSVTSTVGSEAGVTVSLKPGKTVIVELTATRGTMKIKVDYEAVLTGAVAVNYKKPYKNHHFWWLDVREVTRLGGLPRVVKSSEVIEVGYYSDSKIVVSDANSREKLYTLHLENNDIVSML